MPELKSPRMEPVTRRLSDHPLVEMRIAFISGPNGEAIEDKFRITT
jgi:hypothetical protein